MAGQLEGSRDSEITASSHISWNAPSLLVHPPTPSSHLPFPIMSSQQRSSSSGVRDLRAMFEKKDGSSTDLHAGTESPDRGRSPSSISARGDSVDKSPAGAARKIRSSFVNVDAPSSAAK